MCGSVGETAGPPPAQGFSAERRSTSRSRSPSVSVPSVKLVVPPVKFSHRRTAGEVWRCKKGHRSEIKPSEWAHSGYALKPEVLTRPIEYSSQTVPLPRLKRNEITPEYFQEHYLDKRIPCIIEGGIDHWPAMHRWSTESFEERFRHVPMKVGKSDSGKKLRMKYKYFVDYMRKQMDDSPLYLFETDMDENAYIRRLTEDYEVPDIFPDDWFNLVNHDSRPPWRWFCVGPARSGTTVHIDPLGTDAWNAVTHGEKHWVLFEPSASRRVVKGKDVARTGEKSEAIDYFDLHLPRIKRKNPELKVYEALQKAGDIIYVPGNWWHGVVNTEDCVAVTQNFVGAGNFEVVWKAARKEREKVANLWLRNMRKHAPDLYQKALDWNRRDNFRMRHERPAGHKLSDGSSSSSESSSDSSSDELGDLGARGLDHALPAGLAYGPRGHKRQKLTRRPVASPLKIDVTLEKCDHLALEGAVDICT